EPLMTITRERLNRIAVRIEECKAVTRGEILADEVLKEGRLAGSCLAHCIDVHEAVALLHTEETLAVTPVGAANYEESIITPHGPMISCPREIAQDGRSSPLRLPVRRVANASLRRGRPLAFSDSLRSLPLAQHSSYRVHQDKTCATSERGHSA